MIDQIVTLTAFCVVDSCVLNHHGQLSRLQWPNLTAFCTLRLMAKINSLNVSELHTELPAFRLVSRSASGTRGQTNLSLIHFTPSVVLGVQKRQSRCDCVGQQTALARRQWKAKRGERNSCRVRARRRVRTREYNGIYYNLLPLTCGLKEFWNIMWETGTFFRSCECVSSAGASSTTNEIESKGEARSEPKSFLRSHDDS